MTKKQKLEKQYQVTEFELLEMMAALTLIIEDYQRQFESTDDSYLVFKISALQNSKFILEKIFKEIEKA